MATEKKKFKVFCLNLARGGGARIRLCTHMRSWARGGRRPGPDTSKYMAIFDTYKEADAEEPSIGPDGVEKLCADMGVDPSDVTLLVLAWAMGASKMGYLTHQEWETGAGRLGGASSAAELQKELQALFQALLGDIERFRDLHSFTHRFCREDPRRKNIDVNSAVVMLGLLFKPTWPAHASSLCEYFSGHKQLVGRPRLPSAAAARA